MADIAFALSFSSDGHYDESIYLRIAEAYVKLYGDCISNCMAYFDPTVG